MTRRRWLAVALGLLLAVAAAWALATWPRAGAPRKGEARREEPHADIDEASRERLREVLREEDAREGREEGEP